MLDVVDGLRADVEVFTRGDGGGFVDAVNRFVDVVEYRCTDTQIVTVDASGADVVDRVAGGDDSVAAVNQTAVDQGVVGVNACCVTVDFGVGSVVDVGGGDVEVAAGTDFRGVVDVACSVEGELAVCGELTSIGVVGDQADREVLIGRDFTVAGQALAVDGVALPCTYGAVGVDDGLGFSTWVCSGITVFDGNGCAGGDEAVAVVDGAVAGDSKGFVSTNRAGCIVDIIGVEGDVGAFDAFVSTVGVAVIDRIGVDRGVAVGTDKTVAVVECTAS